MSPQKFSVRKRIKSFGYAFEGMKVLFREEHNAWIHLFISVCVVIAGIFLEISSIEWIAVVLCMGMVLSLEAINSAIEGLSDFSSPKYHDQIKKIKDLAAAGVLLGAIAAAIVGLIIFLPALWKLIG